MGMHDPIDFMINGIQGVHTEIDLEFVIWDRQFFDEPIIQKRRLSQPDLITDRHRWGWGAVSERRYNVNEGVGPSGVSNATGCVLIFETKWGTFIGPSNDELVAIGTYHGQSIISYFPIDIDYIWEWQQREYYKAHVCQMFLDRLHSEQEAVEFDRLSDVPDLCGILTKFVN